MTNKCYLFAKEFFCTVSETEDFFELNFGDGELVDKDGDSYFVVCGYDYKNSEYYVQVWYDEFVERVYFETELGRIEIKRDFLSEETILEIIREFKKILELETKKRN